MTTYTPPGILGPPPKRSYTKLIGKTIDLKIKPPLREKENIDLTFTYADSQILIIENKVKSLPYKGQLEEYSKTHNPNKSYLLLSLYKPDFVDDGDKIFIIDQITWKYLSYNELAVSIKKIKPNYDITECNESCFDETNRNVDLLIAEDGEFINYY